MAPVTTRQPDSGTFRPIGEVAAEVVADHRFQRRVIDLCKRPRLIAELLAHLGAERGITTRIDQLVEEYADLDPAALEAAGGDDFWQPPLHGVER